MSPDFERSLFRWALIAGTLSVSTFLVLFLYSAKVVVEAMPKVIDNRLAAIQADMNLQLTVIHVDSFNELDQIRKDLNVQLNSFREETSDQLTVTRAAVLARTDFALVEADKRLTVVTDTLTPAVAGAVSSFAVDADSVTRRVNDIQADLHQNWLGDKSMGYARFLALTGEGMRTEDALRRMAEEGAKAAPAVVDDIKADSAAIREYIAPKTPPKTHWYTRWLPTVVVTAGKILF